MAQRERPIELGRLVQDVQTGLVALADQALAPLEVTPAQWKVLATIARAGDCRASLIVETLGHDQAAVSRLIARLVAKKLVRRKRDPADARALLLALTPKGAATVNACRQLLEASLGEVLAAFGDDERAVLESLLLRLAQRLPR